MKFEFEGIEFSLGRIIFEVFVRYLCGDERFEVVFIGREFKKDLRV